MADLAGPEHDVQSTLAHERILADSEQPGRRRQSDLDACYSRYASSRKLAINFLKMDAMRFRARGDGVAVMAIDTLEAIQAGGTTQWIRVRGADAARSLLVGGLGTVDTRVRAEHPRSAVIRLPVTTQYCAGE